MIISNVELKVFYGDDDNTTTFGATVIPQKDAIFLWDGNAYIVTEVIWEIIVPKGIKVIVHTNKVGTFSRG